jgi:hypothetical protein
VGYKETNFVLFWRALPGVPLGLTIRAWRLTKDPGQARILLGPWLRGNR